MTLIKDLKNGFVREAAFSKVNREILIKNVNEIASSMSDNGFFNAELIQVFRAEDVPSTLELYDNERNIIDKEDANKYFLIADGQHRYKAAVKIGIDEIPATLVETKLSFSEYLNKINLTKAAWTGNDYIHAASIANPKNEVLQFMNELQKDGCNPSSIQIILFGVSGKIKKNDFYMLATGETTTSKGKRIIPDVDITFGKRLIEILLKVGFSKIDIYKRYLLKYFYELSFSTGNIENAFKVYAAITPDDRESMYIRKKLNEEKMIEVIKNIKERVLN